MTKKNTERDAIARSVWLFGLGTVAAIEEEASKLATHLKDTSEDARKKMDEVVKKATEVQQEIQSKVDSTVKDVVEKIGIPSQVQVKNISSRIEELSKKIEALTQMKAKAKD